MAQDTKDANRRGPFLKRSGGAGGPGGFLTPERRFPSSHSAYLYRQMLGLGYPDTFCDAIARSLPTAFTATRMSGYLDRNGPHPMPLEEVADEMLAILSDRDRIVEKKKAEAVNIKLNELMNGPLGRGMSDDEEDGEGD